MSEGVSCPMTTTTANTIRGCASTTSRVLPTLANRVQASSQRGAGSLEPALRASDEETLDFFPAPTASAPLLMFIHGGYWRAMHKDDFAWIAPPYTEQGIAVANVNYALAPKAHLGEIVTQVRRAVGWLHENAVRLGFDSARLVCSGHSAGGHLAAMLLATEWGHFAESLPSQPLRGAVAISGLFDLEPLMRAEFLRQEIVLTDEEIHDLSPVNLAPSQGSHVLTVVGELESSEFYRQSRLLVDRWGDTVAQGPVVVCGSESLRRL